MSLILILAFAISSSVSAAESAESFTIFENDNFVKPEGLGDPTYPGSGLYVRAGDILVTNNTILNGFTGHAAIVIGESHVAEIRGYGHVLEKNTILKFFERNMEPGKGIKVIRYNDATKASQAAQWASRYVDNYSSTVTYELRSDLYNYTSQTYCSKLVWNAFYYGANVELKTSWMTIDGSLYLKMSQPYDLPQSTNVQLVGMLGTPF